MYPECTLFHTGNVNGAGCVRSPEMLYIDSELAKYMQFQCYQLNVINYANCMKMITLFVRFRFCFLFFSDFLEKKII
jgi:hypothetical protein